jgi:phenylacetate-CoA ligase
MVVLDRTADWHWWIHCWQYVLETVEVTSKDIAMMAFSSGPLIRFWTANDALVQRGALLVPGGGLSNESRLRMIHHQSCALLGCTPMYALHLLSVADNLGRNVRNSSISREAL